MVRIKSAASREENVLQMNVQKIWKKLDHVFLVKIQDVCAANQRSKTQ